MHEKHKFRFILNLFLELFKLAHLLLELNWFIENWKMLTNSRWYYFIRIFVGLVLIQSSYGFFSVNYVPKSISLDLKARSIYRKKFTMTIKIENENVGSTEKLTETIGQFLKTSVVKRNTVRFAFAGQILLLIAAFIFGTINHVDITDFSNLSFDVCSMWLATKFGLGALGNAD